MFLNRLRPVDYDANANAQPQSPPPEHRQAWLRSLLGSATMRERMAAIRDSDAVPGDDIVELPLAQFSRWEQLLGGDADSTVFPRLAERLRWENFTLEHAALALKTLPSAARDLLLKRLMKRPWARLLKRALPGGDWSGAAWEELRARCEPEEWALAERLRGDLQGDLDQRLDWWLDRLPVPDGAKDRPALARVMATECTHWARAWKLFLRRWLKLNHRGKWELVRVHPGDGDPHQGGQRVVFCDLEEGRFVYKPRSVTHEQVFGMLTFAYRESAPERTFDSCPAFGSPEAKPDWGWMVGVDPIPLADLPAEKRTRFAQGCGALLCFAHVSGATDLHYENLIFGEGGPVLIDLESVFFRYTGPAEIASEDDLGVTALSAAAHAAEGSVWQTGLLPQWWRPRAHTLRDISGFFGGDARSDAVRPMESRAFTRAALTAGSAPFPLSPSAIMAGFQDAYCWMLQHREDFIAGDVVTWWLFNPNKTRYFHRPTREYERLRERLREPGLLKDGVTRSFALERLFRLPFEETSSSPPEAGKADVDIGPPTELLRERLGRMSVRETLSLERGDVPSFRIEDLRKLGLGVDDLPAELSPIAAFGPRGWDGREAFLRRILEEHLSEADLRRQLDDVRTALSSAVDHLALYRHLARLPEEDRPVTDLEQHFKLGEMLFRLGEIDEAIYHLQKARNSPSRRMAALNLLARCYEAKGVPCEIDPMSIQSSPVTPDARLPKARENATLFAKAAETLAERLLARAVRGQDGSVLWVSGAGLKPTPSGHPLEAYYLYLGRLGPILFLAAAGWDQDRADFTETALGALEPLLKGILKEGWTLQASADDPGETPPRLDPGFGTGIGGLLYGLAVLSRWLPEKQGPRLEAAARELLPLMEPERWPGWACADIESGLAGGILGLLAAHQTWELPHVVPYLRQYAQALEHRAVPGPEGTGKAWYFPDAETGQLMAGFGHGASGIAAALCRMAETPGVATDHPEAARWLALAAEAWRYEATVFDAEKKNWPVVGVKRETGALFLNAWCNGAPGIGYSRVLGLGQDRELLPADGHVPTHLTGELTDALRTTLMKGISAYDHVCCGTGARLEALLSIAPRLPVDFPKAGEYRAVMLTSAASLGRAMLNRAFTPNPEAAATAGDNAPESTPPVFRLTPNAELDLAFNPGFFRGISGLGYLYLRLAQEERAFIQNVTDSDDLDASAHQASSPDPAPGERLPSVIFGEL